MRYYRLLPLLFLLSEAATAQPIEPYHHFANLFAETHWAVSPRYAALAGSGVALGGDASSASVNPASLGQIRRSQIAVSLGSGADWSRTAYLRTDDTPSMKGLGYVPGIQAVFASKNATTGRNRLTFSLSINRANDFHRSFQLDAFNNQVYSSPDAPDFGTSLIDYAIGRLSGFPSSELDALAGEEIYPEELAYAIGLVNPETPGGSVYTSDMPVAPFQQEEQITETGAQYDINFGLGGSIGDRLYLGAATGIQHIYLTQVKQYKETYEDNTLPIRHIGMEQTYDVTGVGINLHLGAIYRLHDFFRLGVSYRTPTAHRVSETYQAKLETTTSQGFAADLSGIPLRTNYSIFTPGQISGGLAVFLGKRGFITADVAYADYSNTSLGNGEGINFSQTNDAIETLYAAVVSFRGGIELRVFDDWRIRGGYAHNPIPQVNTQNLDQVIQQYNFGGGYYGADFNVNFSVSYQASNRVYEPFSVAGAQPNLAISEMQRLRIMLGIGFYFDRS